MGVLPIEEELQHIFHLRHCNGSETMRVLRSSVGPLGKFVYPSFVVVGERRQQWLCSPELEDDVL